MPTEPNPELFPVRLITAPVVIPMMEMAFIPGALRALADWVREYRPECLPGEADPEGWDLFPHDGTEEGRTLTANELYAELCGRNCYHSYGAAAGRKTNSAYIAHSQSGRVPHRSILYHPKMSFFVAGVSRHLTHELMRHYVGADRDQEGSPSQESTRYTLSPGHFVVPPRVLEAGAGAVEEFRVRVQSAYTNYRTYVEGELAHYARNHDGTAPRGLERKRIYEDAATILPHSVATSVMWTTNPIAAGKMFTEREDESAGLEFRRLAGVWRRECARWANLFPPPAGT